MAYIIVTEKERNKMNTQDLKIEMAVRYEKPEMERHCCWNWRRNRGYF